MQPRLVGHDEGRHPRVDQVGHLHALLRRPRGQGRQGVLDDRLHLDRLLLELRLAGLQLRKAQNVVDDREQGVATILNGLHKLLLLGRELRVRQQVGKPDDAVHRGPDFVAHVGQKLALGLRGRQRFFARRLQLARPLGHLLFEQLLPLLQAPGPPPHEGGQNNDREQDADRVEPGRLPEGALDRKVIRGGLAAPAPIAVGRPDLKGVLARRDVGVRGPALLRDGRPLVVEALQLVLVGHLLGGREAEARVPKDEMVFRVGKHQVGGQMLPGRPFVGVARPIGRA